ncbi:protein kinase domain-containing protein [Actinokineospora sp.]|uniref:protein kinase domain-containing protein n=1 Tax=Actinokineospora sp. TaxID=1872133 RepID=UPI00403780FC
MDGQGDADDLLAWGPKPTSAPEPATTAAELSLPGYRDFRLIAQGGEGTVYRARQVGLGRDVAVKVLQVDDPATLARFRRELEITVRLGRQHPHIITVLDTGTVAGGRPCIVMEFYDLGSLHDRLREHGPLPVAEVVAAGMAVADALAFAHGQGFLHRDVKPQNILVLPTSYVLADFGIARGADAGHSASLQMVSYRHAAPQMIDGGAPAAADDLWSLGSTLFTLLEGVPPFASDNPDENTVLPYLGRIRSAEPRGLTRPDVPPELAAVIERCLHKQRERRFPDAAALRSALSTVGTREWEPTAVSSTVDDEATAMAPRPDHTQRFSDGPTSVPDFGPRPPEPILEPELPAPPTKTDEPRGTMTGNLAELTVRHAAGPVLPDFGPAAAEPYLPPVEPVAAPVRAPAHFAPPDPDWDLSDSDPTDRRAHETLAPQAKPRRGLVFAVAAIVTVVAGVAIGVLTNRGGEPAAAPPTTTVTTTVEPTTTTATGIPQGGDPKIAPVLNRLADTGSSIEVFWSDPTGGRAQFVLYDVTAQNAKPEPVTSIAAGVTSHLVADLDPKIKQYCYQLVAIGLDDPATQRGASARVCAIRN